jgi:hypothetical protein
MNYFWHVDCIVFAVKIAPRFGVFGFLEMVMSVWKSFSAAVTLGVLGAFAVGVAATPAAAKFIEGSCTTGDVTAGGNDAAACLNYSGNNNNYNAGIGAGYENYIATDFDLTGSWYYFGDIGNGGSQTGTWTTPSTISNYFVIAVKAANFFAAYLFAPPELSEIDSGTYDVAGATTKVGGGSPAGLSHLSLYIGPVVPCTINCGGGGGHAVLPEYTTLGMFGIGCVGLGLAGLGRSLRRHRAR